MGLDRLQITDKTLQSDVQALLASNPTGNLRGKRTQDGIVLYFSPVKANSTGVADFLARLGLGALRERRLLAAEALEKVARQTAEAQPGASRLTKLYAQSEGRSARGVRDITAAQVAKDWGKLSPRMVALAPYFAASPGGRAHEQFRDFRDNLDAINAASSLVRAHRSASYDALDQLMQAETYRDERKQLLDDFIEDVNNGLQDEKQMAQSAASLNSSYGTAVLNAELKSELYAEQKSKVDTAKALRVDLIAALEEKMAAVLSSAREQGVALDDGTFNLAFRRTVSQYLKNDA